MMGDRICKSRNFLMTVCCSVFQDVEIEVEAVSKSEAYDKALGAAPNIDFSGREQDADYSVVNCRLV